ncbi:hypothetical protein JXA70_03180 [candidate division KSB1 bacterium]|nr:hypothetical protein [candidate division KSB1 bacterium]
MLKRLLYECHYIKDIPACLISLDDRGKIASDFDLVEVIREELKNFQHLLFTKFDKLNNARMLKDPTPFTEMVGTVAGMVNAEHANITDRAIVAGHVDKIIQNVEKLVLKQRDEWPSQDYEKFVRQYCIEAFFSDLNVICTTERVVILLDAWERCEESLKRWIIRPMLNDHCFEVSTRPDKLIFVLAGRELPPLKDRLKTKYSNVVTGFEKLSEWSREHMREFLKVHGYEGLTDTVIDEIRQAVNTSKSLDWALKVVRNWLED